MHKTAILLAAFAMAAFACDRRSGASTKPALYTADQANAGAAVYAQSCATCHGSALEGTAAPALKGPGFADTRRAQSLTADMLFDVISGTMPQSDPGSLKPDEYAAVTAYHPATERLSRRHSAAGQGRGRHQGREDHAIGFLHEKASSSCSPAVGGRCPCTDTNADRCRPESLRHELRRLSRQDAGGQRGSAGAHGHRVYHQLDQARCEGALHGDQGLNADGPSRQPV